MSDIVKEMGFIFCDLINHCSQDLLDADMKKILPILEFLENNNNFEASFLLANYHDPSGCLFNTEIKDTPTNHEKALAHYGKAAAASKNGTSDREKNVFECCIEMIAAYEKPK